MLVTDNATGQSIIIPPAYNKMEDDSHIDTPEWDEVAEVHCAEIHAMGYGRPEFVFDKVF
jgi:hypothetical protein